MQIFQEIGKQAKITFDTTSDRKKRLRFIWIVFPLKTELSNSPRTSSVFYAQDPKDKSRRIEKVVVLSDGKESARAQTKTSTQPERVREPAPQTAKINKPLPQPEPFKFEFDPGKFTEKEKSRKQP